MNHFRIWLAIYGIISLLIFNKAEAQEGANVENICKVNILTPGISYETRIGNKQTLYTEAYLALSFAFSYSSNFGSNADFAAIPSFEAAYRYYYNYRRRANKGLTTAMNNMNYVTFVYNPSIYNEEIILMNYETEKKLRMLHTIGIAWGFQRNYNNRISLDMYVGPGCAIYSSTGINIAGQYYTELNVEPTLVLRARLGLWLNRRR